MSSFLLPEHFRNRPYAAGKLQEIVQWALTSHPFYRQKYKRALNSPCEIPLLTRAEILANNDLLLNGHPETGRTSGSTGIPVRFSWSTQRQQISRRESLEYTNQWLGGALPRAKIIRLKGTSDPESADIGLPAQEQVNFLQQRFQKANATSVITYPTNAAELSRHILDKQIDMSHIQRFSCYAEAFEGWQEQLVQRAFPNARIYTTYSATELGMIAARCPHEPSFHHVFAKKLAVEILDQNNRPCADGVLGRVVITDYFNRRSPFIRYDIGDLAAYAKCPCGKINLPALTKITGKVRGLLRRPNGQRVMFSNLDAALRDIPGIAQFQVVQKSLTHHILRFVASPGLSTALFAEQAKALFYSEFGPTITLTLQQEDTIERGSNGKFYASICEID